MTQDQANYQTAPAADVIRFQAIVNKVQTLVDGGVRVSLDLVIPTEPGVIVAMFDAKQPGIILECACVAIDEDAPYKRRKNGNEKK